MKRVFNAALLAAALLFFIACGSESKGGESEWEEQNQGDSEATTDGDVGNSAADSGNSAADSGNSGGDSGDSAADSGDSGADSGNSGADSGNSGSDSGSTGGDSGNSGSDSGNSGSDSGDSGSETDSLNAKFVGTWAEKIILRSTSSTTMAKNVPSVTTKYAVVKISIDENGNLDMDKVGNRICRTDNRSGNSPLNKGVVGFNEPNSKFNTVFFHWKPSDVPGQESVPYLEAGRVGDAVTFKINKDYELRGAKMEDIVNEPMPKKDDDPRIFDHDEDENPAFTITFNGFVNGQIYYVQRLSHVFNGKLVGDDKIEGTIEWTDEQYTHQKTPNAMLKEQKTTETDSQKSVFQFVRVSDDMNCENLLGQLDAIFDIVDPNGDVPEEEQ